MSQGKTEPVYIFCNKEWLIHAPISVVWSHAINYISWQNYSEIKHISGERGQEGEVIRLKKAEAGIDSPAFYGRTLKMDAPHRIVWKTYRDTPDYFGIVEFKFLEAPGGTTFFMNLLYEHIVPYESESDLEAFRKERYRVIDAVHASVLPKLKALAENGAA